MQLYQLICQCLKKYFHANFLFTFFYICCFSVTFSFILYTFYLIKNIFTNNDFGKFEILLLKLIIIILIRVLNPTVYVIVK